MSDEDVPSEPDLDTAYFTRFRQHVQQTHLHLRGHDPLSPLAPFYTQNPTSHWTSAEKSAFFHGLSVYSRLRPDLIAEHVKTKNVIDVCAYMNMLEDGAHGQGTEVKRKEMEVAMEVSEEWIKWEEEKATGLIVVEEERRTDAGIARENETKEKKRELMPRRKRGEEWNEEQERKRNEFKEWHNEQKDRWDRQDLLRSMGVAHLKVIDNILREEEEALKVAATSRQGTLEPTQSLFSAVDIEMIDPILRAETAPIAGTSTAVQILESKPFLQELSPASRRRTYKRLYMRRKRAEAKGNADALSSQAADVVERVKPGRKSRPRKRRKTDEGNVVGGDDDSDNEDDEEEEEEREDLRHPHIGGKTRHYKIKGKFEALRFDARALQEKGLGLFHLSALAKLMKMYNLLHDVPATVSSEISADTIQLLHELVVQYVTDLVHRTIVSREQEREMKSQTRAWRFKSEQIAPGIVEHALDMIGSASQNKEKFLAGVFERLDVPAEEVDADPDSQNEDSGQGERQGGSALANHKCKSTISIEPLYHTIYTPFVHLPSILGSSHIYEGSCLATSPESEDPLFPSDTDEDALIAELEDEDALDAEDDAAAQANENVLWGEYGRRRRRNGVHNTRIKEEEAEVIDGDANAHDLRFKPPGMDSKVKSKIYISDSD